MKTLSFLIGILAIVMGLLGVFQPDLLVSVGRYSLAVPGLYLVGAARLIIGVILFLGAKTSRAPGLPERSTALALVQPCTSGNVVLVVLSSAALVVLASGAVVVLVSGVVVVLT